MTPHAALQAARTAAHAEGYAEIRRAGEARHVLFKAERSAFQGNPQGAVPPRTDRPLDGRA